MKIQRLLLLIGLAVAFAPRSLAVQSLNLLRSEVRDSSDKSITEKKPSISSRKKQRHSNCEPDAFDSLGSQLVGEVFLNVVATPFLVPRFALDDDGSSGYFVAAPYQNNLFSITYDPTIPGARDFVADIQLDVGTNFDQLFQTHGRLVLDGPWRIGVDSEVYHRYENGHSGSDTLWNGDVNVVYRFAQDEHWQLRAGLGMNWMYDRGQVDTGFNSTYSVDWFPTDPIHYSGSIDLGTLGDATVFHLRNTIGITRGGWGVFTGHDYFRAGDFKTNAWINGIEFRY